MNWKPFGLFNLPRNSKKNGTKKNIIVSEVEIGQLFENGPLIEVIEFAPIPLEEKKRRISLEKEMRLNRKRTAKEGLPKRLVTENS